MAALLGKMLRHIDKLTPPVGQAVGHDGFEFGRHIARQRVAHLNRWVQGRRTLGQDVAQVLPGVLASAEEQCDPVPLMHRHDARGEYAGTLPLTTAGSVFHARLRQRRSLGALAHQLQNLDCRIIVVQHIPLSGLPNQLMVSRLDLFGLGVDNVPLGRGRQGDAEIPLQALQAVEG